MKMTMKFASSIEFRAIMMSSVKIIDKLGLAEELFGEEMSEDKIVEQFEEAGLSLDGFTGETVVDMTLPGMEIKAEGLTYNLTIDPITMVKLVDIYAKLAEMIRPMLPEIKSAIEKFVEDHEDELDKLEDDMTEYLEHVFEELGFTEDTFKE